MNRGSRKGERVKSLGQLGTKEQQKVKENLNVMFKMKENIHFCSLFRSVFPLIFLGKTICTALLMMIGRGRLIGAEQR